MIVGFALVGVANGTVLLARAAAADMVPPERRPRQISLVLFGAVAGAILGPFVFSPLFAGRHLDAHDLVVPWLAAGGFMIGALVLVLCVRPDPQVIARELAPPGTEHGGPDAAQARSCAVPASAPRSSRRSRASRRWSP